VILFFLASRRENSKSGSISMPPCRTLQTVMRSAAVLMIWAAGACAFAPSPAELPRLASSSSFSAPAALLRQRRRHLELPSSSSSLPMMMQERSSVPVSRKAALLLGVGAGISTLLPQGSQAITYGSGDFSGTSAVNGVLSAYGLPQLPDQRVRACIPCTPTAPSSSSRDSTLRVFVGCHVSGFWFLVSGPWHSACTGCMS